MKGLLCDPGHIFFLWASVFPFVFEKVFPVSPNCSLQLVGTLRTLRVGTLQDKQMCWKVAAAEEGGAIVGRT